MAARLPKVNASKKLTPKQSAGALTAVADGLSTLNDTVFEGVVFASHQLNVLEDIRKILTDINKNVVKGISGANNIGALQDEENKREAAKPKVTGKKDDALDDVMDFLKGFGGFFAKIKLLFDVLVPFMLGVLTRFKDAISEIDVFLTAAIGWIMLNLRATFNFMKNKLGLLLKRIALPITIMLGIVEGVLDAIEAHRQGGTWIDIFRAAVVGIADGIVGWIFDLGKLIPMWLADALGFEEVAEAIEGWNFKSWFSGLLTAMQAPFESIIEVSEEITAEMQKGEIWSGMKKMLFAPIEIVKRIAGKLFDLMSPVAKALGIDLGAIGVTGVGSASPPQANSWMTDVERAKMAEIQSRPRASAPINTATASAPAASATASAPIGTPGTSPSSQNMRNGPLLDLIASGESGAAGYDAYWNGSRVKPKKPVSQMTFDEVMAWQKETLNEQKGRGIDESRRSSAVGRYQFISKTLKNTMEAAGFKGSDKFSPENQDKLALALLDSSSNGLSSWRAGKTSDADFVDYVASQWASVKNSRGRGTYDAAGFNHGSIGGNAVLESARASLPASGSAGSAIASAADERATFRAPMAPQAPSVTQSSVSHNNTTYAGMGLGPALSPGVMDAINAGRSG